MGAQSNFPSVFDTATHNPASKNPGKASVQNTHFNSNPGTPTHTTKTSNGAYSSMGNASAVSKATEESVMNTSSTLDEQPPATSAPRRGRQHRDSNRAEVDTDFDDEKTLKTAGHRTINASNPAFSFSSSNKPQSNPAFSYSQGPGSTRSMPVADSSSVRVPAQRQPLSQAGAVDSSFLGAGHQTMDESSFAGVPTESVSVLQANYDSDSEFGGDTTTILTQLQVQEQQQRHMHETSETSHFDVGSDSDTEHDESISIPPPQGAPTQVDEFVACVGSLAPPPGTSAGFTTTTVTGASSQISSHRLHQLPVQNRSAGADRPSALMQPNAVHYGYGTESSVIATTEQSTSSHPVQYSCDTSSAVSNICPGGRGVAASRAHAHAHARMHGGGDALASDDDDDDDDSGGDEESETSFASTDLDVSTAQMHDSDLRSRVYGAVSSIASQSQATTPGTAGGPRHRHVFQRPVLDGSTLLTPTQMAKCAPPLLPVIL